MIGTIMPIRPPNTNNVRSVELGASHEDHEHAHSDLTGVTANQHHDEDHAASHADGGADELDASALASGAASDGDVLTADGAGAAAWEASSAHGGHVTNGDSHDHAGGDGAQVDHGGLAGLADDDHTQYHNTARHAAVDAADHSSGASSDGQVLTSDGAGGAAWEDSTGGLENVVEDTTPQLGGDLDSNGNDVLMGDDDNIVFGDDSDAAIQYISASNRIQFLSNVDFVWATAGASGANVSLQPDGDLKFLLTDRAEGDLWHNTGGVVGTVTRLPIGSAGEVLQVNSGATAPEWGGGWQTWTPTLTNITQGNGTVVARYSQVGKTVTGYFSLLLGSTSSVSSNAQFSLPVTASSNYLDFTKIADGTMREVGGSIHFGAGRFASTSRDNVRLIFFATSGSSAIHGGVSSTQPFTWGENDYVQLQFTYEAA